MVRNLRREHPHPPSAPPRAPSPAVRERDLYAVELLASALARSGLIAAPASISLPPAGIARGIDRDRDENRLLTRCGRSPSPGERVLVHTGQLPIARAYRSGISAARLGTPSLSSGDGIAEISRGNRRTELASPHRYRSAHRQPPCSKIGTRRCPILAPEAAFSLFPTPFYRCHPSAESARFGRSQSLAR